MHFTAAPVALNLAQKFEALAARSPSFRPSDPDLPRRFGRSTRSAFKLAQGEDQLAFVRSWRCHAPAKAKAALSGQLVSMEALRLHWRRAKLVLAPKSVG